MNILETLQVVIVGFLAVCVICPPVGLLVFTLISMIIEHYWGDPNPPYVPLDAPDFTTKEGMRWFKSHDRRGYEKHIREHPEDKVD